MTTIRTTTKDFKAGLAVDGGDPTIVWESTGHLAVRLTDELGQTPLAGRAVKVSIPGEGTVELVADADGVVRHPDVPFQDYELDLGGAKVRVPAVANLDELHERHAPGVFFGFVTLLVSDEAGEPIADAWLAFEGPISLALRTNSAGVVWREGPVPDGAYQITSEHGGAEVTLPRRSAVLLMVTLVPEGAR